LFVEFIVFTRLHNPFDFIALYLHTLLDQELITCHSLLIWLFLLG